MARILIILSLIFIIGCLGQTQYKAEPGENVYESIYVSDISVSTNTSSVTLDFRAEPALWCPGRSGRTVFLFQAWIHTSNNILGPKYTYIVINDANDSDHVTLSYKTENQSMNTIQTVVYEYSPPSNETLSNYVECKELLNPHGEPTIFKLYEYNISTGKTREITKQQKTTVKDQ